MANAYRLTTHFICAKKLSETDLNEYHMDGKSLNISLKVPVEDVFIAPSEPIIAFCENGSNEWKKGVFTTHTQFDQSRLLKSLIPNFLP
jgi:hypothetical protein